MYGTEAQGLSAIIAMHPEWHILICQGLGYHSYEFVNQEVILLTTQLLFALAMNLLSLTLEYGYLVNTVWVSLFAVGIVQRTGGTVF